MDKCPACGNDKFVYDYGHGAIICASCGTVVEEGLVDTGPEWRAIEADEKRERARAGPPAVRHTAEAFMTAIDWGDRDAEGKGLDFKRRLEAIRLRRWQDKTRARTGYEHGLFKASRELERLSNAMGIPRPCVERALELYRAALVKELNKGRPADAMVAAALYAACRMLKMPRTLNELTKYTAANRSEIVQCYRLMVNELGLKMPLDDPILHIPRIAGRLNLPSDVVKTAIEILQRAKRARRLTSGKDPTGVAAAALYLATKIHGIEKTQEDIAVAADVSEATVRNRAKLLAEAIDMGTKQRMSERDEAEEGTLHKLARRIAELLHQF